MRNVYSEIFLREKGEGAECLTKDILQRPFCEDWFKTAVVN